MMKRHGQEITTGSAPYAQPKASKNSFPTLLLMLNAECNASRQLIMSTTRRCHRCKYTDRYSYRYRYKYRHSSRYVCKHKVHVDILRCWDQRLAKTHGIRLATWRDIWETRPFWFWYGRELLWTNFVLILNRALEKSSLCLVRKCVNEIL